MHKPVLQSVRKELKNAFGRGKEICLVLAYPCHDVGCQPALYFLFLPQTLASYCIFAHYTCMQCVHYQQQTVEDSAESKFHLEATITTVMSRGKNVGKNIKKNCNGKRPSRRLCTG